MYKEIRGFTAIGLLKVLLVLSTLVWAAIVDSLPASADAIPDQYSGVTITDATAQAAPSGGNSVLRFRLVNEGTEPLTLLGVTSEQITESRILGQTSHGTPESLGSINIPVEETLDLQSFHLKIELSGMKRSYVSGQVVTLNLAMVRGEFPINAHVH